MAKLWLPNSVGQEYQKRRQMGADPFPEPKTNREEIVHELWQCGVWVAGWWLEDTEYLKDLLDKYKETQVKEAEQMEKEAAERVRRSLLLPNRAQISERLRDVRDFNQAKREGRKRVYQGSGTQQL